MQGLKFHFAGHSELHRSTAKAAIRATGKMVLR
jgi:hypothetical protein